MSASTGRRGNSALPTAAHDAEPGQRGRLVMGRNVVEKVASQAALEAVATSGRSPGLLGFGAKPDPRARPKVDAELSTNSADLAIAVGLAYPCSLRTATQQIRDHVTRRVEALTGVDVRRVDIDVTFLNADAGGPRTPQALR